MKTMSARFGGSGDGWAHACSATALVSLLLIVVHIALPPLSGLAIPYAGGAAVVLGVGAVLCSVIRSRTNRLIAASSLFGLMIFRVVSPFLPGLFISSHGGVSLLDGIAMGILIFVAGWLLIVAMRSSSSRSEEPMQAVGPAGC
jgi:hypothetical protein